MSIPQPLVSVGDPMPRIVLPSAAGTTFDSIDQLTAGLTRVYWLEAPPPAATAAPLTQALAACDGQLHVVAPAATEGTSLYASWLLDPKRELAGVFGATGPLAIVVDPAGRVASILPAPTPEAVAAVVTQLHKASTPVVIQGQAPVMILDRVLDPALIEALLDYWRRGTKMTNVVASNAAGNVANADAKRRQDVQLDEPGLFVRLRDCLGRRVMPMISHCFGAEMVRIEAPWIGCYDATSGGWFRRHRDNSSRSTAHRQFALTLNLNGGDEYAGGEVRFPEFGRQLYRPAAGGALVFSCSLLHEVMPVTRGRRFGVFTFLSGGAGVPTRSLPR